MDHMSMSGGNDTCVMTMLWNWNTIDSCFLSSGWQIQSNAAFVATCIGVASLAIILEALRRASREFDIYLSTQLRQVVRPSPSSYSDYSLSATDKSSCRKMEGGIRLDRSTVTEVRATPIQQLLRTILHVAVFGVAYLLMLLAMYYNGYIIFSILLGTGVGKFCCDWMVVRVVRSEGQAGRVGGDEGEKLGQAAEREECPTVCC